MNCIYDVVKSKRRHWLAVTLSFTPCGDRQTDIYTVLMKCLVRSIRRIVSRCTGNSGLVTHDVQITFRESSSVLLLG